MHDLKFALQHIIISLHDPYSRYIYILYIIIALFIIIIFFRHLFELLKATDRCYCSDCHFCHVVSPYMHIIGLAALALVMI